MRRILTLAATAVITTVAFFGGLALAQTLDEVVADVERQGWYAERDADVDTDDLADLLVTADDLVVVVLAGDDPDGADFAADQVRDELAGDTTVLVITPGEVAAVSDTFGDADLDGALDAALDRFDAGGTTTDAVGAFGEHLGLLEPQPVTGAVDDDAQAADAGEDGGGGGGGGLLIFLLVVVVIIGGFVWFAKRKGKQVDTAEVERARTEIRAQLEVVAHEIVEYEDEIDVSGNEAAIAHFRSANATYAAVSEKVEETENLLELASLNDEIDRARWELQAAQALIDGRDVPPKPEPEKPTACFFDPTHKPGSEECTIKTSAGDKEVRVCRSCADKLERGERPEPRMIDVGGRRVPAAKAPRSHGGLGMGGLSIFEVILGGLGALVAGRGGGARRSQPTRASSRGVDLDWGEMLPKRRPRSGTFGPDRLPPRPRGIPRSRASKPAGSSRRSRSPSAGGSRSRGRGLPSRPSGRSRRRR